MRGKRGGGGGSPPDGEGEEGEGEGEPPDGEGAGPWLGGSPGARRTTPYFSAGRDRGWAAPQALAERLPISRRAGAWLSGFTSSAD